MKEGLRVNSCLGMTITDSIVAYYKLLVFAVGLTSSVDVGGLDLPLHKSDTSKAKATSKN